MIQPRSKSRLFQHQAATRPRVWAWASLLALFAFELLAPSQEPGYLPSKITPDLSKLLQPLVAAMQPDQPTARRLAAMETVIELASQLEGTNPKDPGRTYLQLRDTLIKAIESDKTLAVRLTAIRAFSSIYADLDTLIAVFDRQLKSPEVAIRRQVADSLDEVVAIATAKADLNSKRKQYLRTLAEYASTQWLADRKAKLPAKLTDNERIQAEVDLTLDSKVYEEKLLLQLFADHNARLLRLACSHLADPDPQVRRGLLTTLLLITQSLRELEYPADDDDALRKLKTDDPLLKQPSRKLLQPLIAEVGVEILPVAQRLANESAQQKLLIAQSLENLTMFVRRVKNVPFEDVRPPAVPDRDRGLPDPAAKKAEPLPPPIPQPGAKEPAEVEVPLPNLDDLPELRDGLTAARPLLANALSDSDPRVRLAAAEALEAQGAFVVDVMEKLAQATEDRFVPARWVAVRAISRSAPRRPQVAVPALARRVLDPDLDVRSIAIEAVVRYGKYAGPAVPALVQAASQGDTELRVTALVALGKLPDHAAVSVPALLAGINDTDDRIRKASVESASNLAPRLRGTVDAERLVERITGRLRDTDPEVRSLSALAILRLTAPASK